MRQDLRKVDISAGRSINLAFSNRGLKAIKLVGLESKVESLCIPIHGRMIHDTKGNSFLSNYSGRENEFINSIFSDNNGNSCAKTFLKPLVGLYFLSLKTKSGI